MTRIAAKNIASLTIIINGITQIGFGAAKIR